MSLNIMVTDAKAAYSSNLVSNIQCNPKVLFDTITNIVSAASSAVPIFSSEEENKFPSVFVGRKRD